MHRSEKTFRVTGLCEGSPVNSPHKGPVTRKMFPFDDVIIGMSFQLSCFHYTGYAYSWSEFFDDILYLIKLCFIKLWNFSLSLGLNVACLKFSWLCGVFSRLLGHDWLMLNIREYWEDGIFMLRRPRVLSKQNSIASSRVHTSKIRENSIPATHLSYAEAQVRSQFLFTAWPSGP